MNEIQNKAMFLPGNLGEISICGQTGRPIESVFKSNDGRVTITIGVLVMSEEKIDDQAVRVTIESIVHKQLK